ncbi:MAG TPA: hypothetical protein VF398_00405, partial [bacterium]
MRGSFSIIVLCALLTGPTAAQLSGALSGQLGPGSYAVVGNIWVATGSSLNIAPGTTLLFGPYRFKVDGLLTASGNAADSIHFARSNSHVPWKGIHFTNISNDLSCLDYCAIAGSDSGGVRFTGSNARVSHCTIRDNRANVGGGLYSYDNSNQQISHCRIVNNTANSGAGGVFFGWGQSAAVISDCIIAGNHAPHGAGLKIGTNSTVRRCRIYDNVATINGGGIEVDQSSPQITGCYIHDNVAVDGAGISVNKGSPIIWRCLIAGNTAAAVGGGIADGWGSSQILHCTIVNNHAAGYGSALVADLAYTDLSNSVIAGNTGSYALAGLENAEMRVQYCGFYDNEPGNFLNLSPALGVKVAVNANGDSCDTYENIFEDPIFADPVAGDYRITWASFPVPDSTRSPCIDAGSPLAAFDPDSTIADQGTFYFNQSQPVIDGPAEMASGTKHGMPAIPMPVALCLLACFPNPFNPSTTISYQLSADSPVRLQVLDVSGRLVATLVNGWRDAGVHEAIFDGAELPSGIY